MGRPPIGERAMTAHERKLRWRERHRERNGTKPEETKQDDARRENVATLREQAAEIDRLTKELAKAQAAERNGTKQDDAPLREENERLREEIAALAGSLNEKVIAECARGRRPMPMPRWLPDWQLMRQIDKLTKERDEARAAASFGPDLTAELAKRAREVAKLQKELAQEKARVAALEGQDTEAAKMAKQLKGLRTQVRNLKAHLRVTLEEREKKVLFITKAKQKTIRAGLHPDNVTDPGAKRRLEAAFKAWESLPIKIIDEDGNT